MEKRTTLKTLDIEPIILKGHSDSVLALAMTKDGKTVISGSDDGTIRIWDVQTQTCKIIELKHCKPRVIRLMNDEFSFFASGTNGVLFWFSFPEGTLRETKTIHKGPILDILINQKNSTLITCGRDKSIKEFSLPNLSMIDVVTKPYEINSLCMSNSSSKYIGVGAHIHSYSSLYENMKSDCLDWTANQNKIDKDLSYINESKNYSMNIKTDYLDFPSYLNHTDFDLFHLNDSKHKFLSINELSHPTFFRIVNIPGCNEYFVASSRALQLLIGVENNYQIINIEGHLGTIFDVAVDSTGKISCSASSEGTVCVWDVIKRQSICLLQNKYRTEENVFSVIAISCDGRTIAAGSYFNNDICIWHLPPLETLLGYETVTEKYTTAKIVMVGASGAGKTSLSHRLCEDQWKLFDSTHGMNITKLDLPDDGAPAGHDREAWLWDLAGQPDYRLIHQLFLDETAAALLVFNPQDPDPFAEVSFWNRVLDRLVDPPPAKLLIASRGDVGGLTISQKRIDDFLKAHGFAGYIPTSAKSGMGRKDLIDALAKAIPWDRLPTTSSPVVFKKLKDNLLELREQCESPLLRMDDLRERMVRALPEEPEAGEAIKGVVRIFEHQGVLRRLPFGDFILLKPEIINDYAAVITQNARQHQDEMGCILERDVLEAKLNFHDRKRLPNPQDEKLLLAATVQLLIEKALCLKEETPEGTYLVFPSYFRRERDEKPTYPEIHVTYSFTGNVDELYASLVVRLAYSGVFIKEELWQHAADFKTLTDGQAGVSVTDKGDGKAELVVYFSNDIALDSKITFLKFVHEHFQRRAFIVRDVQRVRTYVCAKCHYIHDLAVVSYRVREGEKELICPRCGICTSIYDEIEERFSSDEFEKAVRAMEETAQITIDNQSKEMMLIGQVFDTVGQAGQIFRPTSMFDWGIDGELEFTTPGKDKKGNNISIASGTRLYLQLKSGDSYLRKRKDGTEVFDVSERHADYWQKQRYDVMLIVRNSDGSARWMNITDALKRTKSLPKHIVFTGEPFTKESVVQYRKRLLNR